MQFRPTLIHMHLVELSSRSCISIVLSNIYLPFLQNSKQSDVSAEESFQNHCVTGVENLNILIYFSMLNKLVKNISMYSEKKNVISE